MRRALPVLVLLLLSPIVGEMLSGSTPLAQFFNPVSFLFQVGLYGAGAVLIRELVRRRGLGWPEVVLLGAAYGMIEEGLQIQSFFNVHHPDLGVLSVYGRALGVNWVWAEELIGYHAIWSITIPIILTELLFPAQRATPWLGRRGFKVMAWVFGVDVVLGFLLFTLLFHHVFGYVPPPIPYLATLGAVVAIAWLVLRQPARIDRRAALPRLPEELRPTPRPWLLRLLSFGAALTWFIFFWGLSNTTLPAPILMLMGALLAGVLWWLIARWSRLERIFDDRHLLALASGPLVFLALLDILILPFAHNPGKNFAGQWLVGMAALTFLIALAWRVNRRMKRAAGPSSPTLNYVANYGSAAPPYEVPR
jgi:hypothetical protein